MQVEMEDRLPCRLSEVEADIEPVWRVPGTNHLNAAVDGPPDSILLDVV
jgi:hypothetical protein